MQFVNLDQQIFVPVVDETHGGAVVEMKMTVGEFFSRSCPGFEPETIEAIPVEWLEEKTRHSDNHTQASAKWMLGCWKREQEAR
jgi:hypothetical protein